MSKRKDLKLHLFPLYKGTKHKHDTFCSSNEIKENKKDYAALTKNTPVIPLFGQLENPTIYSGFTLKKRIILPTVIFPSTASIAESSH